MGARSREGLGTSQDGMAECIFFRQIHFAISRLVSQSLLNELLEIKNERSEVFNESISNERSEFDIFTKTTYNQHMKIFDLIEEVKLEIDQLNESQRYMIHSEFSSDQWAHAGRLFLQGITLNSVMPTQVLVTLRGIQDFYNQHRMITHKQSLYITHAIIDYWDQMSLDVRSALIS